VAKNVVAAGLADRCEAQVAYAIGKAKPVGLFIECFGTERLPVERIQDAVTQVFDLRPRAIIAALDLLRPIYSQTAAYGHFGRTEPDFSWERTDRAEALKAAAGVSFFVFLVVMILCMHRIISCACTGSYTAV
jgi:S-adenosylmethionine synthetase